MKKNERYSSKHFRGLSIVIDKVIEENEYFWIVSASWHREDKGRWLSMDVDQELKIYKNSDEWSYLGKY